LLACIYSLVLTAVCTGVFVIDNPFAHFDRTAYVIVLTMVIARVDACHPACTDFVHRPAHCNRV
jgi:hypothetical protein